MVIYQPSIQVVTLHLTFSSTGCEPAETQTLLTRLTTRVTMQRSGAKHTLSNQQAQVKQPETR